jgi:tRNA/rRNA methyltransferase
MSLENFAFILFQPRSGGNVGAAARALKNMGCGNLRLVEQSGLADAALGKPKSTLTAWGYDDARTMAVRGSDVLDAARVYPTLDAALTDCTLVIGTTARTGRYRREARSIRELAAEFATLSQANRIGFVFGPEDRGLTNQELKLCQRLITIPVAPDYPSLNLAQAVMIVAYELMLATGSARELPRPQQWARLPEVDAMLTRMMNALVAIGFLPVDNPDHIMFALRAILGRAGLTPRELDILNGIARQVLWFSQSGCETVVRKQQVGEKLK